MRFLFFKRKRKTIDFYNFIKRNDSLTYNGSEAYLMKSFYGYFMIL